MLHYSIMLKDPAMTGVSVTLNLGYLLCYYIYSENKVSTGLIFSYITLSTIVFFEDCYPVQNVKLCCLHLQWKS
jgi:hypothetical protein